jgi:hypothetical protein
MYLSFYFRSSDFVLELKSQITAQAEYKFDKGSGVEKL